MVEAPSPEARHRTPRGMSCDASARRRERAHTQRYVRTLALQGRRQIRRVGGRLEPPEADTMRHASPESASAFTVTHISGPVSPPTPDGGVVLISREGTAVG
jgi:hypothetical protein